jgi:hypothetical protein
MAIPGQTTSNIVGSTWHPQTPEEAAMERMQLERQWELADIKKAGQEKGREQEWSEMRRREEEARMREAFNKVYGSIPLNAAYMRAGGIVAPRPEGVNPNYVAYTDPKVQGGIRWGPQQRISEQEYQNQMAGMWDMWKANQILGYGGGYGGR